MKERLQKQEQKMQRIQRNAVSRVNDEVISNIISEVVPIASLNSPQRQMQEIILQ